MIQRQWKRFITGLVTGIDRHTTTAATFIGGSGNTSAHVPRTKEDHAAHLYCSFHLLRSILMKLKYWLCQSGRNGPKKVTWWIIGDIYLRNGRWSRGRGPKERIRCATGACRWPAPCPEKGKWSNPTLNCTTKEDVSHSRARDPKNQFVQQVTWIEHLFLIKWNTNNVSCWMLLFLAINNTRVFK